MLSSAFFVYLSSLTRNYEEDTSYNFSLSPCCCGNNFRQCSNLCVWGVICNLKITQIYDLFFNPQHLRAFAATDEREESPLGELPAAFDLQQPEVVYSGCGAFLRLEESRHMDFPDVVCQMVPHPIRYNECDPSSVHRYNPQQHDKGTLRGSFFYTQVHVRTTQDTQIVQGSSLVSYRVKYLIVIRQETKFYPLGFEE